MGGLIGINDSWFRSRGLIEGYESPDECVLTGMYSIGNSNVMPNSNGSMYVFSHNFQVVQIFVSYNMSNLYIRGRWNNNEWSEWSII